MAKQYLSEKGVMPNQFYSQSLSDFTAIQLAQSREDRLQDPFELIKSLN